MRGFTHYGKQVRDVSGEHFADAATEVGARLIVAALNYRNHLPVVTDGDVVCSRCRAALPEGGDEPCVPRAPRCPDTVDMFDTTASRAGEGELPHSGTEPRRCACGAAASIVINDVPLCSEHGAERLKAGAKAKEKA